MTLWSFHPFRTLPSPEKIGEFSLRQSELSGSVHLRTFSFSFPCVSLVESPSERLTIPFKVFGIDLIKFFSLPLF